MIKLKTLFFPVLFFIIISFTSCFLVEVFFQEKQQDLQERFSHESEKKFNAFKQIVSANIDVGLSLQAFFHASQFVSRKEFRNYTGIILNGHPEIQALNWLPRILHQDRSGYEQKMRNEGFDNYTILEKTVDNRLIQARQKQEYYPLHYLEPFEKNKRAFALDSSTNSKSLATINNVVATQKFSISSPLTLIQEMQNQLAILIFFPVYKEDKLAGLAELVLRMGDVLDYTKKHFDLGKDVLIDLYDVNNGTPALIASDRKNINATKPLFYNEKIWLIGGKKWKAEFYSGANYVKEYELLEKEFFILQFLGPIAGFFMSGLFFFVILQKNKTERTARQYQLSQQHFKQLINQTADAYFLFDASGKILDVNQRGCKMLRFTREEFLQLSIFDITLDDPDKQKILWDEVKLGETVCFEGFHLHKDGQHIPVEDSINHFLLDNKPVFSALSRDITERVLNTQALKDAHDKALDANRAKSVFLSNMSHEIRTPMHGILSFARFGIKNIETADKDKLRKYFDRINQSGERLLILLNDLLDLSKLEAGKMELHLIKNNLYHVVDYCVKEQEARIKEQSLKVKVDCEAGECSAVFDKARISQVVTNLLSNAIKFTPEGKTIVINIRSHIKNNKPALCFSIQDEGVGIPEDELKVVFDKFIQSCQTTTSSGGTGLGLSICQEIIHLHQGEIWAEPIESGGALFKFIIPVDPK